jgi:hypothetical protein
VTRLRSGPGSRGDGTSHLLILQQLDVQISLGPAGSQHHLPCAAWWTASSLRPSRSFRYTQAAEGLELGQPFNVR